MTSTGEAEASGDVSAVVDELHDRASALSEDADALAAVFPPSFMECHTDAATFEAFLADSEWAVSSRADFAAVPRGEFDAYVADRTTFDDFEEMLGRAGEEWIARQLGL